LTRYRATVAYDGTNYFGFQRQVDAQQTIQGELEKALFKLAQASIQVTGAGRTDTGVHARGQVIAFDIAGWRHGEERLQRALNGTLPHDIAVRDVQIAHDGFHPRFDATRRGYRYTILNRPNRSPLRHRYTWHVRQPLDIAAMNAATVYLIGEHDFGTFGTPPHGLNRMRRVFRAEWHRDDEDCVIFSIEATAFLKRMVRSLVGSLRLVGIGSWSVSDFATALQAAERSRAGQSAPPQGLVLEFVSYDLQ
jgi:tRNA pseudouridine38-40 synthase